LEEESFSLQHHLENHERDRNPILVLFKHIHTHIYTEREREREREAWKKMGKE